MSRTTRTLLVALVLAVSAVAVAGKGVWDGPTKQFSGKLSGRTKFTITLPSSITQMSPASVSYMFELADADNNRVASLTVGSMIAFAQHPQTYDDYKASWLKDAKILREEKGDRAWGVLFLDTNAPDDVTALFASPTGDSQSTCLWDAPKGALEADKLPSWDAMKKACRTIAFTH